MKKRQSQVSTWTVRGLVAEVRADKNGIISATIKSDDVVVYRRADFITWDGANNAVHAKITELVGDLKKLN